MRCHIAEEQLPLYGLMCSFHFQTQQIQFNHLQWSSSYASSVHTKCKSRQLQWVHSTHSQISRNTLLNWKSMCKTSIARFLKSLHQHDCISSAACHPYFLLNIVWFAFANMPTFNFISWSQVVGNSSCINRRVGRTVRDVCDRIIRQVRSLQIGQACSTGSTSGTLQGLVTIGNDVV